MESPLAPTRRTQAERRALSKQRLLDAAELLIAEKGASRTTLAEIGERAGYSRGLANQRFGSKRELISQLCRRIQKRFLEQTIEPALRGRTGIAALLATIDACLGAFDHSATTGRAFYTLMGESIGPVAEIREPMARANREFRAYLERELERGIEAGEIRADLDVHAQAASIVGVLRGIVIQWLLDPDSLDLVALRRELCQSLERALRAGDDRAN